MTTHERLYAILVVLGILAIMALLAAQGAVYRRRYHHARREGRREALRWAQEARCASPGANPTVNPNRALSHYTSLLSEARKDLT